MRNGAIVGHDRPRIDIRAYRLSVGPAMRRA